MDNIRCNVRIKPRSPEESAPDVWRVSDNQVVKRDNSERFLFSNVLDSLCDNATVFDTCARPLVDEFLKGSTRCVLCAIETAWIEGTNVALLVYGQSGSGKTHTLSGRRDVEDGLIQLALNHVLDHIAQCSEQRAFMLRLSIFEIYNEHIQDLIGNAREISIRDVGSGNVVMEGLHSVVLSSLDDFTTCFRAAEGETVLNDRSSRSHLIIRLEMQSCEENRRSGSTISASLNLVDLAGSENASSSSGQRLTEGLSINKSLFYLTECIRCLSTKEKHVPFRNSRLTRVLKSSLGGNSKTLIICTINAGVDAETLSTLKFARNTVKVANNPTVNKVKEKEDDQIGALLKTIDDLKKQLEEKEAQVGLAREEEEERLEKEKKLAKLTKDLLFAGVRDKDGKEAAQSRKNRRHSLASWAPRATVDFPRPDWLPTRKNLAELNEETEEAQPTGEQLAPASDGVPAAVEVAFVNASTQTLSARGEVRVSRPTTPDSILQEKLLSLEKKANDLEMQNAELSQKNGHLLQQLQKVEEDVLEEKKSTEEQLAAVKKAAESAEERAVEKVRVKVEWKMKEDADLISQLRFENQRLQSANQALQEQSFGFPREDDREAAKEEIRVLQQKIDEQKDQIFDLDLSLKKSESALSKAIKEKKALEKRVSDLTDIRDHCQTQLQNKMKEIQEMELKGRQLKSNSTLFEENRVLGEEFQRAKEESEKLAKQKAKVESEKLTKELSSVQRKLATRVQEVEKGQKLLEMEKAAAKKTIASLEFDKKGLEAENKVLRNRITTRPATSHAEVQTTGSTPSIPPSPTVEKTEECSSDLLEELNRVKKEFEDFKASTEKKEKETIARIARGKEVVEQWRQAAKKADARVKEFEAKIDKKPLAVIDNSNH